MDFSSVILTEMIPLIAVLNVFGALFKKIEKIPNWAIVFILGVLGIGGALIIMWVKMDEPLNAATIFTSIVQGILCAASAVGAHQFFKQVAEGVSSLKGSGATTTTDDTQE